MPLYRRGKTWWVRFTAPDGQRVQQSAGTRDRVRAQEYHELKAELWKVAKLGNKPDRVWEEAVVRWLNETAHKASHEKDRAHLRWLNPHLRGVSLRAINRDAIDRLTHARVKENVSNATVNRMLEVLRAILRKAAKEWEWTDHIPYICLLPEPKRRIRGKIGSTAIEKANARSRAKASACEDASADLLNPPLHFLSL